MNQTKDKLTNYRRPDDCGNSLEEQKKSERVGELLGAKQVSKHQRGQENIGRTK